MGGSQGARDLNRAIVETLTRLQRLPDSPPLRVVHLTGSRHEEDVRALYAEAHLDPARVDVEIVGFEHDMARRYAEADLCISRAGASSCFELALVGLPAIFVPLPGLARDHQSRNAESLAERGAGVVVAQATLDPDALAATLAALAASPDRRAAMRDAFLALARPDAAERVADLLQDVAPASDAKVSVPSA